MIGLDTNVLMRHLAQDDPVQSPVATRFIERGLTEQQPGFVSIATTLETVWVLQSVYGLSCPEIADVLERTLQVTTFVIQNEAEIFLALHALRSGHGGFDDALIAALGRWAGCASTFTFDKKACRLPGFELIV